MATIRDNVVILNSDLIKSVSIIEDSATVTENQPFDFPPQVSVDKGVVTILFKSGRKKSKPVADKFSEVIGGMGHAFAPQGGDGGLPKELNFMFGINITWKNGKKSKVYLGQGNNFLRNNWWIGSADLKGQEITSGDLSMKVSGLSVEDDIGESYKKISDNIPEKYRSVVDLIGKPLFKEIFGAVNVFTIK